MGAMEQIGRYRVERRIGAGSFATVWLATAPSTGRAVAVKVLAENWTDDTDVRHRFLNEARIMRGIQNPRVVGVHDIGTHGQQPYFVMDYCDAGSLQKVRSTSMHPGAKLRLCADACRAVAVLHSHHVVHRDVTPSNLLLHKGSGNHLEVRLADLGVAKDLRERAGQTMAAGTPAFMAPEQARGDASIGPHCDVYSLAAMTYTVLSSRVPFPRQTMLQLVQRPEHVRPGPIAESIGAPAELDSLLNAGLSIDPQNRPPDATTLADALDAMATQMGTPAGPVPASARTTRPHRSEITPVVPLRRDRLAGFLDSPPSPTAPPAQAAGSGWSTSPQAGTMHAAPPGSREPAALRPSEFTEAAFLPSAPVPAQGPEQTVAPTTGSAPSGWELTPDASTSGREPFPRWLIILWASIGGLTLLAIVLAIYIAITQ